MSGGVQAVSLTIEVDPPRLSRFLGELAKRHRILLVNLDVDETETETYALAFDLIFDPKPVQRRTVVTADYYVGSTGAELWVEPSTGKIQHFTQSRSFEVDYTSQSERQQRRAATFKPRLELSAGEAGASAEAGGFEIAAGSARSEAASFRSEERDLVAVFLDPELKWVLQLPRGERAVRDYLQGNLRLDAEIVPVDGRAGGTIRLRPSDIRFFGPDRRPLNFWASMAMRLILWQDGIRVHEPYPERIDFSIKRED